MEGIDTQPPFFMSNMKKKTRGEPCKMEPFLEKMKEVLMDPKTVVLTDKELLIKVNSLLPREQRISKRTFEYYKSPSKNHTENFDNDLKDEFRETIEFARVEQKLNLTEKMMSSENARNWKAFDKILEVKFDDMQVVKKTETTNRNENIIKIEAGSKEDAKLIGDLISHNNIIDLNDDEYEDVTENE